MKKFALAAAGGIFAGAVATTQVAAPLLAQEAAQMSIAVEPRPVDPDLLPAHLRQPRLDLEGLNFYEPLHPVEEAVAARAGADRRRRLAVLPS